MTLSPLRLLALSGLLTAMPALFAQPAAAPALAPVSQWRASTDAIRTVKDLGGIAPLTWVGASDVALAPSSFFGAPAWKLAGDRAASAPHATVHGALREALTVEAWVRFSSAPTRDIVIRKPGQFSLDFFPEADGVRLRFLVWQGGQVQSVSVAAAGRLDDDRWHHLAGVLNKGAMELFVDGRSVEQRTFAHPPTGSTVIDASNQPLWIAGIQETPTSAASRGFTGLLAELRLTGRALPPTEFGPRNPLTGKTQADPAPLSAQAAAALTPAVAAARSLQPPTGGLQKKSGLVLLTAGSAARPFLETPAQVWRLGNWYYGQQEVIRTGPTAAADQSLRLRLPLPTLASGERLHAGLITVNEAGASLDLEVFVNGIRVGRFDDLADRTTFKQFHPLITDAISATPGDTAEIELRARRRDDGDRINLVQFALGSAAALEAWHNTWDFPALPPPPPAPDPATIAPYRLATGAPWNGIIYYTRRVRDQAETIAADAKRISELGFTATFQDLDSTINLNSLRHGLHDNAQFNSSQKWQLDLFRNHGLQMVFNVYRLQLFTGEDFYSDLPLVIDASGKPIGAPRYPKWMSSAVIEAEQTQDRMREIWADLAKHYVETPNYLRVRGEDGKLHPVFLLWSPFFFDLFDGHVASYDAWAKAAWVKWQQRTQGSVRWPEPPRERLDEASWAAWQAFRGEYVANNAKIVADLIREKVPGAWFAVLLKQHNFVQSVGKSYVSVGSRGLDPRHYGWAEFIATETHRFGIYSVLADLDLARDMPSRTGRPIFIHYLVGRANNLPHRYPWSKRELVGSMLLRRALAVQYGYNERDDFAGFAYFERPDNVTSGRLMWPEVLPDIRSGNEAYNTLFDHAQATPPVPATLAIHLPAALYTVGDNREDWNQAIVTPHRELLRRNLAPSWLLNLADLDARPAITALVIPDSLAIEPEERAALARFTARGGRVVFISIPEAKGSASAQLPGVERRAQGADAGWATVWDAGKGKVAFTTLDAVAADDFGARLAAFVGTRPTLDTAALDVETGLIGPAGNQVLVAVNHAGEPREVEVTIEGRKRTVRIPAHDTAFFSVGHDVALTAILPPPAASTKPVGPTLRDADVWARYREFVFQSAGETE